MPKIRRLQNESAGFINDVSNIIATEAWKNPSLIPDLSSDKTLFVFSDYSRVRGKYKTYSFLLIGRSSADYFNSARKSVRVNLKLENRRMSYKGLNDKIKLNALPTFLRYAEDMNGLLLTFAVDTQISKLFSEQFLQVWPALSATKKNTLEDMLRVVHFGAQAIMTVFSSGQNIVWFTDSDAIVANEEHEQLFGKLAETMIRRMFIPEENVKRIAFGLSGLDDGSLEIEDFLAIPDLVAGALCETLDQLRQSNLKVTPQIALKKPKVTRKTDVICTWIGQTHRPLRKVGVVLDKVGIGKWDFRSTIFYIHAPYIQFPRLIQDSRNIVTNPSAPIRFDIEDY